MKIFKLFACLSKEELKILRKAVISPIYNTNQKVVRLFEILRPLHPNFDDSVKARKKIFKKIFPEEAYNDYKLRWHFTELTKVMEQLLLYIGQETDEFERQKRLAEIYRKRDLYPQFTKENTALLNQLKVTQTNFSNADFHLNKLQLLEAAYAHPSYNKYDIKDKMLEQALDSLDVYYILKKLRLTISLKSKERIQGKKYPHRFLDTLYHEIEQKFKEENKLLNLYQQAIKSIEEGGTFEFDKYEQNLFSHISFLDKENQKLFLFNGLNYLIRKYNKDTENPNLINIWHRKGLELGLFIEDDIINEITFGNIVLFGSSAKAFKWTEKFMLDYHINLKEEIREEAYAYHKGIWYFYQNRLDESLEMLNLNNSITQFSYKTKIFVIRILFKKFLKNESYYHTLSSSLISFQAYVKRDTYFLKSKFIPHTNFIIIIRKVIDKIMQNERKEVVKNWLTNECKISKPIYAKKWLLETINKV